MRYLFNSFSLPDQDLAGLLEAAAKYGYDGLELRNERGHGHNIEVDSDPAFRRWVRSQLQASGLTIDCLCLSAKISDPAAVDTVVEQVKASIDLASDIGVPYIRVFGGEFPDSVSRHQARQAVIGVLGRLAEYGADKDVVTCLETHDSFTLPTELAAIMTQVDHPQAGILWDVWHTGRGSGVALAPAYETLAPWIRHVQMHDGSLRLDRLEFLPIGNGDIDHLELLALLRGGGYTGAIGGEWINWEPAEIHLPRELEQMRRYESLLDRACR